MAKLGVQAQRDKPARASNMLALPFSSLKLRALIEAQSVGGARAFCSLWLAFCQPAIARLASPDIKQIATRR
jgi:hypothetical protein